MPLYMLLIDILGLGVPLIRLIVTQTSLSIKWMRIKLSCLKYGIFEFSDDLMMFMVISSNQCDRISDQGL